MGATLFLIILIMGVLLLCTVGLTVISVVLLLTRSHKKRQGKPMKRRYTVLPIVFLALAVLCALPPVCTISYIRSTTACANSITDKSSIVSLYQSNESTFVEASTSGDYSTVEELDGVEKVIVWDNYTDIECGGAGFGSSTYYYGIFYSGTDDLCAIDVAGQQDELVLDGDGYRYKQSGGDNEYYVEPLGNHFFYYEAHF